MILLSLIGLFYSQSYDIYFFLLDIIDEFVQINDLAENLKYLHLITL